MDSLKLCEGTKGQGQILPIVIKKGIFRVDLSEVLFFEKDLRRIRIHSTGEGDGLVYYGKLTDLAQVLDETFCHCHKSVLVNLAKVVSLEHYYFVTENGQQLEVSQNRFPAIRTHFYHFLNKYRPEVQAPHEENR